jgi:hypothetical protein
MKEEKPVPPPLDQGPILLSLLITDGLKSAWIKMPLFDRKLMNLFELFYLEA